MKTKSIHSRFIFTLSITLLFLSLLIASTLISSSIVSAHEYYGIVDGNGQQSTIYLYQPSTDQWEAYTADSDYVGYSCMIIQTNILITAENQKQIKITNITKPNQTEYKQANETIQAWNTHVINR